MLMPPPQQLMFLVLEKHYQVWVLVWKKYLVMVLIIFINICCGFCCCFSIVVVMVGGVCGVYFIFLRFEFNLISSDDFMQR